MVACELANHNHPTKNTTTKGQDADPPARFASHHHKTAKQTAKGARAQQKQPQKICPTTQWWKPTVSQTQKHAANELTATQWSETRNRRCCQESNNGSHFLYTLYEKPARPVIRCNINRNAIQYEPGSNKHNAETKASPRPEASRSQSASRTGYILTDSGHYPNDTTGAQRSLRFLSGVLCLSSASKRIPSASWWVGSCRLT